MNKQQADFRSDLEADREREFRLFSLKRENEMKEKKDMPEERPKKPSDAKKSLDDIMKRIEPFLPEETQVLHKQYSEWKSGGRTRY